MIAVIAIACVALAVWTTIGVWWTRKTRRAARPLWWTLPANTLPVVIIGLWFYQLLNHHG